MELNINHTIVFTRNLKALENNYRFLINQGGSRSSKTYSIIQLLIYVCLTQKVTVSIVRKSFPALRGSVMRDFLEIMNELNLYSEKYHHKTEHTYHFPNGSIIEFFAADSEQKLRGRKRDIAYCNEANELSYDEFNQINLRTTKSVILDFNPSDNEHWLYKLIDDDRSTLIKSTYKDNHFLSPELVREIENLMEVDENYYKIYALGERPIPNTRVYTHFRQYETLPEKIDDFIYAVDFGYSHASALVKIYYSEDDVYIEEVLYKTHLTSADIVKEFINLGIDKKKYIYADYARPEIIEELRRAGYNMKEANKEVKAGIDSVKTTKVYIHKTSNNIWKEYRMYSWKTNKEHILDEPVKLWDDALDAIRYGIHSHKKGKSGQKYIGFY
jgi:phage terminase large subunit